MKPFMLFAFKTDDALSGVSNNEMKQGLLAVFLVNEQKCSKVHEIAWHLVHFELEVVLQACEYTPPNEYSFHRLGEIIPWILPKELSI
jgi:hypothetical protein